MGCAQSKIDNEESVARCKDRRNFMKDAVSARNAFASGHAGYAIALKNIGAALSDYAQGEVDHEFERENHEPTQSIVTPQPQSMEPTLLPPPPPLPAFSPVMPLQRSVTMPEFSVSMQSRKMKAIAIEEDDEEMEEVKDERKLTRRNKRNVADKGKAEPPLQPLSPPRAPDSPPPQELKGMPWDYFFMVDSMPGPSLDEHEEDPEPNQQNEDKEFDKHFDRMNNVDGKIEEEEEEEEPKTPETLVSHGLNTDIEEETPVVMEKRFLHSKTAPPDIIKRTSNRKVGSNVNLMKVLGAIDDHFLKASEAALEVSRMLEATRMHYHSNFADNQGHIDHAARVMRVITWNSSFKGASNGEGGKGDFDLDEHETHATILDKLLAWEKKLYEEMKVGELMKMDYQRKVTLLNKLKTKRNASAESIEKTKAAVSHLHTRYIVDMQSLDSTVSEVNDIRDRQLYPKLVNLVSGMATMWESMCIHHDSQLRIVDDLKSLEVTGTPKETTKQHHGHTIQIWEVVQKWQAQFDMLVTNQKHYIQSLSSWLKLNLIPIESTLKDKTSSSSSSPPRSQNPPIHPLLQSWLTQLEKLPDEQAKSAIESFAAVIKAIIVHQDEEMKLKEKCEETRKEYLRKSHSFDDWYQKFMSKRMNSVEDDQEGTNNQISERQLVVESLKKRWEEEVEVHQRHCLQVREKSLGSLRIRLPELFRVLSDYSHACADAYRRLNSVTQNANGGG